MNCIVRLMTLRVREFFFSRISLPLLSYSCWVPNNSSLMISNIVKNIFLHHMTRVVDEMI